MSDKAHQAKNVLANLSALLPDLESIYKDIHSHPELSMQENRTAGHCSGPPQGSGLRSEDASGANRSSWFTTKRQLRLWRATQNTFTKVLHNIGNREVANRDGDGVGKNELLRGKITSEKKLLVRGF
jgi:hypothetical protein